jgi:TRAP-type C4-dicarboxylate transport system substrate-binding protein
MRSKVLLTGLLAVAILGGLPGVSVADETITLRVADSLPAGHYVVKLMHDWMDDVSRRTNGKVKFEYYGSEQLGKARDLLNLTLSGVADISYVAPSYVTEKLPLSSIGELPGEFSDSCSGTPAYWSIARGDGILAKSELEPHGVRLMFTVLGAPFQLTSRKAFANVSDVAGFKLRSYGAHQDTAVGMFGGVPIRMAGPQMYESLSRGTLDGLMLPLASVLAFDVQNLVRYATPNNNFGTVAYNFVISERKFKSLPPDVQKAMTDAGDAIILEACHAIDDESKASMEKLKAAGVKFVEFPSDQNAQLKKQLLTIAPEWAANLDKRGLPGTEVLKAFSAALSATK